jgi:nucleoside-triphosphatase THEP1
MGSADQKHTIYLVTGAIQGGKTSFLSELIGLLKKHELKLGGFLAPGSFDSGERSGFTLKNIENGMELPLVADREIGGWFRFRRFWFNPAAFKEGREWIHQCLEQEIDVVVIDEVGPMELEGSGWSDILDILKIESVPVQLWSVRESQLREVMKRWGIHAGQVIHIDKMHVEQAAVLMKDMVNKFRELNQH